MYYILKYFGNETEQWKYLKHKLPVDKLPIISTLYIRSTYISAKH